MSEDTLESEVDLYDSEILAIEKVLNVLNTESRKKVTTVEAWRNEIVNRFAEINFKASVVLRSIEGVEDENGVVHTPDQTRILTTITIVGRIDEEAEFDHDRQAAEVRANIRGLDQPEVPSRLVVPVSGNGKQAPGGLWTPGAST